MKKVLSVMLASVVLLAGCLDWEHATLSTLAGSKAVIDTAQADYEAGAHPKVGVIYLAHNKCVHDIIEKAKKTHDAGDEVFAEYWRAKLTLDAGLAQEKHAAVDDAIAALPGLVLQVKALYTGPPDCSAGK